MSSSSFIQPNTGTLWSSLCMYAQLQQSVCVLCCEVVKLFYISPSLLHVVIVGREQRERERKKINWCSAEILVHVLVSVVSELFFLGCSLSLFHCLCFIYEQCYNIATVLCYNGLMLDIEQDAGYRIII